MGLSTQGISLTVPSLCNQRQQVRGLRSVLGPTLYVPAQFVCAKGSIQKTPDTPWILIGFVFSWESGQQRKKGKVEIAMTHYGMQLQALRQNSGLSRDDVSMRSGISRSTIAKIEAGISIPSIEMMIRLANSLKLRLPALLLKVGVIEKHDTARALTEIKNGNAARLLKRKI